MANFFAGLLMKTTAAIYGLHMLGFKINALFRIRAMVYSDVMTMELQMKVCVSRQLFAKRQDKFFFIPFYLFCLGKPIFFQTSRHHFGVTMGPAFSCFFIYVKVK